MSYRITFAVDVEEWCPTAAVDVVVDALSADIRILTPVMVDVDENDPSPYCTICNAKRAKDCDCGPRAEND
jgi:hypothetical protein